MLYISFDWTSSVKSCSRIGYDGFKFQYPNVNAWCMSGGKVVVYTGLLPITQTEAVLATGHGSIRQSDIVKKPLNVTQISLGFYSLKFMWRKR